MASISIFSPTRATQPYRRGSRSPSGALSAMLRGGSAFGGGMRGSGFGGGTVPRVVGLPTATSFTSADMMGRRSGFTGRSGMGRAPLGGPRTPMRAPRYAPRLSTPGFGYRGGGLKSLLSHRYTL